MPEDTILGPSAQFPLTLRDVVMVLFRRRKLLLWSFLIVFLGVCAFAVVVPRYEARMKIFVRRGRLDPPVTPQANQFDFARNAVTEEEVNSEVELLRSEDVLRNVALKTGLARPGLLSRLHLQEEDEEAQVERAVKKLEGGIVVEPIRKTSLILLRFRSADPVVAAKVLNALAAEYTAKHAELHHPSGEMAFFDQQVALSREQLNEAESALVAFTRREGFVMAPLERDAALQRLADSETRFQQLRQDISQSEQKVRSLHQQMLAFPARSTADIRFADNAELLEKLKSKLLELQLKRTELLTRYEPTYRLVEEVEIQIREIRESIDREQNKPVRDETTEKDPNHEWAKGELEKTEVDLRGLQAKQGTAAKELLAARKQARDLGEASIEQQDLQRTARAAEESYLLYVRKREEARILDALDAQGILNFTVAQAPKRPVLPTRSGLSFGLIAFAAATVCSTAAAFGAQCFDSSIRTPEEAYACLQTPVPASLPEEAA